MRYYPLLLLWELCFPQSTRLSLLTSSAEDWPSPSPAECLFYSHLDSARMFCFPNKKGIRWKKKYVLPVLILKLCNLRGGLTYHSAPSPGCPGSTSSYTYMPICNACNRTGSSPTSQTCHGHWRRCSHARGVLPNPWIWAEHPCQGWAVAQVSAYSVINNHGKTPGILGNTEFFSDIHPTMKNRQNVASEWEGIKGRIEFTTGDVCIFMFLIQKRQAIQDTLKWNLVMDSNSHIFPYGQQELSMGKTKGWDTEYEEKHTWKCFPISWEIERF